MTLLTAVLAAALVSGTGAECPSGYVPPLLANGELSMTVDRTFAVRDNRNGAYSEGLFLAGRRMSHPRRELLPQGGWRKVLTVGGREPECLAWEQGLDISNGTVTCRIRCRELDFTGETFIPLSENTIAIRETVVSRSEKPLDVRLGVRYEPGAHERIVGEKSSDGLVWRYRSYGYNIIDGVTTLSAADEDFTLEPGARRTVERFIVFSDTLRKNPDGPRDYAALAAANARAWAAFRGESAIRLPEPGLQRMWEMANYHLRINATPWSFPVGLLNSHWQGLYFGFDAMYMHQGLASSGHFATARREPDFRFATLPQAIARTSYMGRYRDYGARWHWEGLEDGFSEGTVPGEWQDHIFHMAAIAKCAWQQWLYGRDRVWFAEKGYPVLFEAARYFRRNWVYEDSNGDTYIGKCCDLERLGPSRDHPFMTTVGAVYAMRAAAEASDLLGTNAVAAADFRACADRLVRSLPVRDGRYIACLNEPQESMATLAGFFPFPVFPPNHAPQREAVRHFIDEGRASGNMYPTGKNVCPWYAATMSAAASWMEDRTEPVRWLREAAGAVGLFGEFYEINEPGVIHHPWFATAAGNCLFALNQMLLCDGRDGVRLGFTVPEEWRDYAFRLPSQRGVAVDAEVKGGRLTRLAVTPRDGVSADGLVFVVRPALLDGVDPARFGLRLLTREADRICLAYEGNGNMPAEWSVVVQPVEPRCAKRMRIAGAKQNVRVETDGGVKRFVCDRLTDGAATWHVKVVLEERATADGRVYTGRIENGEKGLRVVGFEGPFGKEVKIDPTDAALYVPDGLGRRVRTFPEDVQGLKPIPDAAQDWISHTWYATDDGRAMFTCGNYPGVSGMTMPWYTMTTGGRGVYAAVHDPEARPKHIRLRYDPRTRRCELGFEHMLFLSCGETWRLGETVFADYAGDWHVAAKKYRAWYDTVRTVGACSPAWMKEISGWLLCIMKQQNEALFWPYTDIPKLCDVAEANGLNCIGLFGWTKGGHDHLYPDYEPDPKMGGVEALKAGIAEAHRRGIRVFIYANGQLQQVGATKFWDEHGKRLALVRENGQLVVQNYHKYSDIPRYDFALGCLGAKPWYDRMLSLAGQAEGFGADAILYDQLGIFAPFACWGEGHGHAVPAYAYAAERPGFLRRLTDTIQKKNPNFAVLTEGLHDTILDSVGLLHGCETGTYPRVLEDVLGRASGGRAEVFPELWRYTFPELMTTVRVPCPMATRTMVNYAAAFGLRHDIELRYAPDRDWALEGKVPTREGYGTVRDVPDVRWMQANDPKRVAAYLKAVNLFQRKHAKYLLEGRFVDDEGFSLKAPAGVLAKRYVAHDGTSAVLVWNMTAQSVAVSVGGLAVASETAEPETGTVAADAPLAADTLRLYVFGRYTK